VILDPKDSAATTGASSSHVAGTDAGQTAQPFALFLVQFPFQKVGSGDGEHSLAEIGTRYFIAVPNYRAYGPGLLPNVNSSYDLQTYYNAAKMPVTAHRKAENEAGIRQAIIDRLGTLPPIVGIPAAAAFAKARYAFNIQSKALRKKNWRLAHAIADQLPRMPEAAALRAAKYLFRLPGEEEEARQLRARARAHQRTANTNVAAA